MRKRIFIILLMLMILPIILMSCTKAQKAVVVDIFESEDNFYTPGIQYARIIELQHNGDMNGTLLATCEKQGVDNGLPGVSFPIFRSTDGGSTWERISDVTTDRLGGMRWEPTFFEFDRTVGTITEGTVLCAGLAIRQDNDAWTDGVLMVFKSTDCGLTWEYMSDIAEGEREPYGIWEPFFILDDSDRLICYYSDCRDYDNHSQKIVYQISEDGGYTWGEAVDVISLNDRNMRPGMPVVTRMGNGRYIMTYEIVLEDDPNSGNQIHYRFSEDGLNWGDPTDKGIKLEADGVVPGSSPYVVYAPLGGENGMLLVTACFQTPGSRNGSDLFVNYNYGEGEWETIKNPLPYSVGGYSHGACVSADGSRIYLVSGVDFSSNSTGPLAKLAFSYIQVAKPPAESSSSDFKSAE